MGLITNFFEYNVFYVFFYNKRVIDTVISSKNQDSLLLWTYQTHASHMFDPDRYLNESGFLDVITISKPLLFYSLIVYGNKGMFYYLIVSIWCTC